MTQCRNVASVVVCAIALLALTGCTPEARVQAKLVHGAVEFVICDAISVKAVRVDGYEFGANKSVEVTLWQLSGDSRWAPGHRLILGKTPSNWVESMQPTRPDLSANEIYLVLNSPSQTVASDTRVATFDPRLLSEESWLTQDGHSSSAPCRA